jgi:hypothetical protein
MLRSDAGWKDAAKAGRYANVLLAEICAGILTVDFDFRA